MFAIEMLPAALGDSLWVEYGDPERPSRFLIDGGLVGTYDDIEAKIREVAAREGGTCRLELLVLSHVDADHIEGLIKLLGQKDLPLEIGDLWFNGAHHLPEPSAARDDEFLGAVQGEFLTALIQARGLPWNQAFGGDTVFVPRPDKGKLPRRELPGGMQLTLVSPGFPELLKLSKRWDEELAKAGLTNASQEEVLAALAAARKYDTDDDFLGEEEFLGVEELVGLRQRNDGSPANGSSIAFVGSFEGKRCLFGGDAYWKVLRDNVRRMAQEEGQEKLALQAFKVPHHGSRNNVADELLAALDCRRFLVSTNGARFKHPDDEAIARMVGGAWRPDPAQDEEVELLFNYRTDFNTGWDDGDLRETWNYAATYPDAGAEGLRVEL